MVEACTLELLTYTGTDELDGEDKDEEDESYTFI